MIYCWDIETKKYSYSFEAQIDPLETELAGHDVYCGLPVNGTYSEPLKPKKGYEVIWSDKKENWINKKIENDEPEPYEPTELEKAYEELWKAKKTLSDTDYRTLKYVDGLYTEEEYAPYKEERAQLRQAVRDAQAKVDELEGK